jgi:hypothetical protein
MLRHFNRTDRILFFVLTGIACALSYLLYDDTLLFPPPKKATLEQIGTVTYAVKDVRKKSMTNFMWLPSESEDLVYQGDSIFTGDDSSASVKLTDGTLVDVKSNSLVVLNLKENQMALDLQFGNFVGTLAKNTEVKLKSGKEAIELKGDRSKFELKKAVAGKIDLKIIQGKVEIKSNKVEKTLAENEVIKIDKTGDEKKPSDWKLSAVAPPNDTEVITNTLVLPNFKWEGSPEIDSFRFIASTDPSMKDPLFIKDLQATEYTPEKFFVPQGPIYWKVEALTLDQKVHKSTEIRKIIFRTLYAPIIAKPEQNYNHIIKTNRDGERISPDRFNIGWTYQNQALSFETQFSKNPNFEVPSVSTFPGQQLEAITPSLQAGDYFFRIRAQTRPGEFSPWSAPLAFKITIENPKGKFSAPILAQDKIKFAPPIDPSRVPASEAYPALSWNNLSDADTYVVQISTDNDFKTFTESKTTSPNFQWTDYKKGKHYMRVYAQTAKGLKSDLSKIAEVSVEITKPNIVAIESLNIEAKASTEKAGPREIKIQWTAVPLAATYNVQISKDEKFNAPTVAKLRSPSSVLSLPEPGTYFIRVQPVDQSGEAITDYSEPKKSTYMMSWPMSPPKLVDPLDKMTVYLQADTAPFIWLYWENVKSSTSYIVELATDVSFKKIILTETTTVNKYLVKQKVPMGPVYWRVRTLSNKLTSDWSQPRSFIVYASGGQ